MVTYNTHILTHTHSHTHTHTKVVLSSSSVAEQDGSEVAVLALLTQTLTVGLYRFFIALLLEVVVAIFLVGLSTT